MVYTEQSLGEALLTRGLIKKKDEEILQDCFARCCMGEHYLTMAIQGRFEKEHSWIWYKLTMFDYLDENTKERRVLGYLQNINKDVFQQEELRRAAQTDALTGLWNVGGGKEHIQKILAGQKEEEINWNAMFLMDVDNFKPVNDTMGHMVGDETLKQLAQVLKNSFEKEDVVFRLGGDEFAAFVQNMENPDEKIAQIMRCMKHELEAAREQYPFLGISTEFTSQMLQMNMSIIMRKQTVRCIRRKNREKAMQRW
ncbi:GGDEF domain-containing protein [Fusicatenibacter sp.]